MSTFLWTKAALQILLMKVKNSNLNKIPGMSSNVYPSVRCVQGGNLIVAA